MNPEQELIFAYLEEDNTQRAYFRAMPIFTMNGDIREEAAKQWPNEGCLRIVPDKNEQHTFKERMRELGAWCMIDLTGYSAEANKIRTNKNYRPDHGEINQYILYSDTVKALPETVFYEVLDGVPAAFADLAKCAITPRFYIRDNDTLYGPVARNAAEAPMPAGETEAMLYELTLPDEKQHMMLCIAAENTITERAAMPARVKPLRNNPTVTESPAPAQPKDDTDEALPIGQSLNILDQSRSFEETLQGISQPLSSQANLLHEKPAQPIQSSYQPSAPAVPLTGTPLYRAPLHTATPQPKNKLQEYVSTQVRVVRNDPPAEPLPSGARLTQVDNPVEAACQSLKRAWQLSDSRKQLTGFIMSLDGIKAHMTPGMGDSPTPLYQAIQQQLQDLEAERLSALVQLDQAKADSDAYRKCTLDTASAQAKAELTRLEGSKSELMASIEALKAQLNLLIAQREEQASKIDELKQQVLPDVVAKLLSDAGAANTMPGVPLRISPVSGESLSLEKLLKRVEDVCTASNVDYDRNRAIAFLTLVKECSRIGVTSASSAAAATLAQNLINGLGWTSGYAHQVTIEQRPVVAAAPADGTPALMMTSLANYTPVPNMTKLMLAKNSSLLVRNAAYEADPWPVFPLAQLSFVPELESIASPVSKATLDALLEHPVEESVVETAMKPILDLVAPLSGKAFKALVHFTAACAGTMDGGLAAACDWATLLWVIPAVDHNQRIITALKPLLAEYPLSTAAL